MILWGAVLLLCFNYMLKLIPGRLGLISSELKYLISKAQFFLDQNGVIVCGVLSNSSIKFMIKRNI